MLKGNTEALGPRVTSIPDRPLFFQETAAANFYLPAIPFGDDTPWFLKSLAVDIRLNAETFQKKFNESPFQFFIYAGSLIFMLSSLGYAIKFSAWPLVNLFLGILVYRGILTLEVFLNTPEMLEIISSFLKGMIPLSLAVPLIFLGLGALMHIYSVLVFVTRRKADYDD